MRTLWGILERSKVRPRGDRAALADSGRDCWRCLGGFHLLFPADKPATWPTNACPGAGKSSAVRAGLLCGSVLSKAVSTSPCSPSHPAG